MFIKIAIILSIILQIASSILAISMTKVAKYNISWIFLTIALLLMALRRVIEFFPFIFEGVVYEVELVNSWISVLTSVVITLAIIYIKRIFNLIKKTDTSRLIIERKILSAIIRTEESERKRFAKDIHDGLGPLLSNLKMSVSTLENIEDRKEMTEILTNMKTVANEAILGLKEISNNLSPHILENYGLIKAVENLVKTTEVNCKISIILSTNIKDERFAYNTEIVLFRIISELINNTIKHAHASKIEISINKIAEKLFINFKDNGVGMDLKIEKTDFFGMGLENILSRIKTLNGEIDIISEPKNGFCANIFCIAK